MGEIDFEDVIFTARVMAFPEKAVMEIRRLREEGYRMTQKLAQAQVELEAKQVMLDEAIRKGMLLCDQNGTLLMEAHDMRKAIEEARKVIEALPTNDWRAASAWLTAHPAEPKADSTGQNGN